MLRNFFFSENCAVYEIMSKNVVEPVEPDDVTIWRTRVACSTSKATCTHAHAHGWAHASTHACTHTQICNIYCFSTATMTLEYASVLRYTYIACLVNTNFSSFRVFPSSFPKKKIDDFQVVASAPHLWLCDSVPVLLKSRDKNTYLLHEAESFLRS
jgi:hypothetical protein